MQPDTGLDQTGFVPATRVARMIHSNNGVRGRTP